MDDVNSSHPVLMLFQTPTRRQRLARSRRYVISGIVGLAVASGAIGLISKSHETQIASAPLAYIAPQ